MRVGSVVQVVVAGALLAACASTSTIESAVVLGPGGRAEGRVDVTPGAEITLSNKGPGRADYSTRVAIGEGRPMLSEGELASGSPVVCRVWRVEKPAAPVVLVVVLEAYEDAGTTVEYEIETPAGLDVVWDLSRAARPAVAQ